jgi:hypothetical protein
MKVVYTKQFVKDIEKYPAFRQPLNEILFTGISLR